MSQYISAFRGNEDYLREMRGGEGGRKMKVRTEGEGRSDRVGQRRREKGREDEGG